ncbi:MAG: putative phosphohydrolase [Candidatus Yanofskybacteria bacterium GW2011_GWD2_39_48]|uniref:Putative phosphohydrolase n=1 Tax=Candidatus Yanofskybacteria bacterium GW2011_GWD2_39_48 TaxID=1619031 RepID=A0A0G0P5Z8_9BACT|nr:MAG: putative phosphohydrolase [Candidatus Yanofskybacteria bacterium GW2011_GWD2_39_48]
MTKFKENREGKRKISDDKKIVVFYHKNCSDGFCSAWVAWRKFRDEAEYIGIDPADRAPILSGKQIYMLDVAFIPDDLKKLKEDGNKIIIIDHHISRKDIITLADESLFDIDHSGCVLTWFHLFPGEPMPSLLSYVEDIDLWKFKLPNTKEIIAYLEIYDFGFDIYDQLAEDIEKKDKFADFVNKGSSIVQYEEKQVERIIQNNSEWVEFEGYQILAVNCPLLHSQIGSRVRDTFPPMSVVWYYKDDHICVSLRSNDTVDVARIAEKFGGGGHAKAAGFNVKSVEQFPWKFIGKK